MSTAHEILQALQQAGAGVTQGLSAGTAAAGKAEQAIQQSAALGAQDKIVQFQGVKAAIEEAIASMNATREKVVQAAAKARAAAG